MLKNRLSEFFSNSLYTVLTEGFENPTAYNIMADALRSFHLMLRRIFLPEEIGYIWQEVGKRLIEQGYITKQSFTPELLEVLLSTSDACTIDLDKLPKSYSFHRTILTCILNALTSEVGEKRCLSGIEILSNPQDQVEENSHQADIGNRPRTSPTLSDISATLTGIGATLNFLHRKVYDKGEKPAKKEFLKPLKELLGIISYLEQQVGQQQTAQEPTSSNPTLTPRSLLERAERMKRSLLLKAQFVYPDFSMDSPPLSLGLTPEPRGSKPSSPDSQLKTTFFKILNSLPTEEKERYVDALIEVLKEEGMGTVKSLQTQVNQTINTVQGIIAKYSGNLQQALEELLAPTLQALKNLRQSPMRFTYNTLSRAQAGTKPSFVSDVSELLGSIGETIREISLSLKNLAEEQRLPELEKGLRQLQEQITHLTQTIEGYNKALGWLERLKTASNFTPLLV